ncbi:hypothetical protein S2091_0337 [Solimicrobium silvestre]|uniref:Excinuclease n=2 Tax=Solimicrobium silvestre TaxID=2099400 RepID=A0A2S9H579_9BURK|nr:excinuclease ATPase subunit [Solimicrobium silvestre]PRC95142.1 hypothetical protein S2091_0337 [Solimicrobium silvestre]
MKKILAIMLVTSAVAMSAQASDTKVMLPIAGAMAANDAQARLGDSVKFYFAGQTTPAIIKTLGSDKVSLKTNAVGKSDEKSCNWVFLSDMISLQKRAVELGANAVVNITNNYNNVENPSATEFECHVGTIMSGVAFKADFVRIGDK